MIPRRRILIDRVFIIYDFLVAESKNGRHVHVNLISSPAGQCISRQPYVLGLIKAVLATTNLIKPNFCIEHDIGHVIGNTSIVKTDSNDKVFYAQPLKTKVYSRFVKNRTLSPSSTLTILLTRRDDDTYEITDTWIGPYCPPFPGAENATDSSKAYWETHAIVADTQPIQFRSITRLCPY